MELPLVAPAPIVREHAVVFRDLFENQCQVRHVQYDLTGLIVLPTKSLANIARCVLDSADKTNLSRFFSEAPWREDELNRRRVRFMLQQTKPRRRRRRESFLAIDDTLCEHVGTLFDDVDRHDNHSDGTYPLAHNPVTSFYVSGPVRFPLGLRLYRRYEELTQWDAAVAKHVPELNSPPNGRRGIASISRSTRCCSRTLSFGRGTSSVGPQSRWRSSWSKRPPAQGSLWGGGLFDAWSVAEDVVRALARRRKDGMSLLKTNLLLETASFHLRDANGWTLKLPGPDIAVEELVPLLPANAYRPVRVHEQTYWCFTLAVRIPGLGKVRIVVSFEHEQLSGRYVVLVTNRAAWSAAKIIGLYLHRWPTEIV